MKRRSRAGGEPVKTRKRERPFVLGGPSLLARKQRSRG